MNHSQRILVLKEFYLKNRLYSNTSFIQDGIIYNLMIKDILTVKEANKLYNLMSNYRANTENQNINHLVTGILYKLLKDNNLIGNEEK